MSEWQEFKCGNIRIEKDWDDGIEITVYVKDEMGNEGIGMEILIPDKYAEFWGKVFGLFGSFLAMMQKISFS